MIGSRPGMIAKTAIMLYLQLCQRFNTAFDCPKSGPVTLGAADRYRHIPAGTRKTLQLRTSIKLNWWLSPRRDRPGQVAMRENEKPTLLTRRQLLASGVAMAGTIPFLPIART